MNIFKILASGDGRLDEPSISAFLGYLLNPNEDHGLGSLFLSQILLQHANSNQKNENLKDLVNVNKEIEYGVDLSPTSDFRVDIFLEQAFSEILKEVEEKDKKCIVDIVLFIYKINYDDNIKKSESLILNQITQKRELKHIILIEIKTKDKSSKLKKNKEEDNQLVNQVLLSKKVLEKIRSLDNKDLPVVFHKDVLDNISMIFIAPNEPGSNKLFSNLLASKFKDNPTTFIKWKNVEEVVSENAVIPSKRSHENGNERSERINNFLSIEDILYKIIKNTFEQKREIIPTYTSETLQSFATFIASDFLASNRNKRILVRDWTSDLDIIQERISNDFKDHLEEFKKINAFIISINAEIECRLPINKENKKYGDNLAYYFRDKILLKIQFKKKSFDFLLSRKFRGADFNEYGDLVKEYYTLQPNSKDYVQKKNIRIFSDEERKLITTSYFNIQTGN